ncbi:putative protein kinase [Trypanosoma grayi]|uniref:putative protein kinase n=1 Tax=Trypanosoma grayi TaxID=71804 RepID=UPI0004F4618E|nr:putative protein kinase [Trypanosoma grayi]KEG07110.1 putative protein kinase [Trypanosoma grayi]
MSIHGPSLRSRRLGYAGGIVTRPKLVDLARSLLETFRFIHFDCQMVHTDVKPENILIADTDTPKYSLGNSWVVCDFGSASLWRMDRLDTDLISTRPYRAPEVVLGNPWFYAADMWSMGCILFEIVTGQRLFEARDELSHLQLMDKRLGPLPELFTRRSKDSAKYFNSQGEFLQESELIRSGKAFTRKLSDVLQDDPDLYDLISSMLIYDPFKRITAKEALLRPIFDAGRVPNDKTVSVVHASRTNRGRNSVSARPKQPNGGEQRASNGIHTKEEVQAAGDKKPSERGRSAPATCNGRGTGAAFRQNKRGSVLLIAPMPQPPEQEPCEQPPQPHAETPTQSEAVRPPQELCVEKTAASHLSSVIGTGSGTTTRRQEASMSPHRSERLRKIRGLPTPHSMYAETPKETQREAEKETPDVANADMPALDNTLYAQKSPSPAIGLLTINHSEKTAFSPIGGSEYLSPCRERNGPSLEVSVIDPASLSQEKSVNDEGESAGTVYGETDVGSPMAPQVQKTNRETLVLPNVQEKLAPTSGNVVAQRPSTLSVPVSTVVSGAAAPEKGDQPHSAVPFTLARRRAESTQPGATATLFSQGQKPYAPCRSPPPHTFLLTATENTNPTEVPEPNGLSKERKLRARSCPAGTQVATMSHVVVDATRRDTPVRNAPHPPLSFATRRNVQQFRTGFGAAFAGNQCSGDSQPVAKGAEVLKVRKRSGTLVEGVKVSSTKNGRTHRSNSLNIPFYQNVIPQPNVRIIGGYTPSNARVACPATPLVHTEDMRAHPNTVLPACTGHVNGATTAKATDTSLPQRSSAASRPIYRQVVRKSVTSTIAPGAVARVTYAQGQQEKNSSTQGVRMTSSAPSVRTGPATCTNSYLQNTLGSATSAEDGLPEAQCPRIARRLPVVHAPE